ncbi:MAG: DUF1998 domain-containing protein [bacterium]|nr:DUF1998 domain-containing protein [bacterium]
MSRSRPTSGHAPEPTRIGGLRPSQMIHTFGPGAVVDLPSMSVVVGGISDWNINDTALIAEARLLHNVRSLPCCARVSELRSPPWMEESPNPHQHWAYVGVPVFPFPRWMRCTGCSRLAPVDYKEFTLEVNRFRPDRSYWYHDRCHGRKPQVVPTRFMVACANGHLDDFPWIEYVHRGGPCPGGSAILELREAGQANRAADVRVICKTCGAQRMAHDAFGDQAWQHLPQCRGRHPHLQRFDEGCQESPRALLLGASNTWFSISRSALTIPTGANGVDEIDQKVAERWDDLLDIEDRVILDYVIKRLQRGQGEQQRRWLLDYDSDEIWATIERHRQQTSAELEQGEEHTDLRGPEWRAFAAPESLETEDFKVQILDVPAGFAGLLDQPIAVDRLREVVALCGFTRIDGPDDVGRADRIAPLWSENPTWLPSAETRGEGLLIRLSEAQVQAWESGYEASDRYLKLLDAHHVWRARRGLDPNQSEPRSRFLLLHSLAHLLIHQVALDCGYSTASIRERLYSRTPDEGDPMAGVLLYTASPDSEGTLGGLVALVDPERLAATLRDALNRAKLCSTDPICADHRAEGTNDTLHHAACHACMFVPETSCEHGNRYLDRATIVPTLSPPNLAYFA